MINNLVYRVEFKSVVHQGRTMFDGDKWFRSKSQAGRFANEKSEDGFNCTIYEVLSEKVGFIKSKR